MIEGSAADFERSPVGRYVSTGSCVIWCASSTLTGWHVWGRPNEDETRRCLRMMSAYPKMDRPFDVVTDTRGVELVNPTALALVAQWVLQNREELKRRVRMQANVIRRDPIGFVLMGIVASVGDIHPLRTYSEPEEAFLSVAGERGLATCAEVDAIVTRVRGTPREVQVLRTLLAGDVELDIRDVAKRLSTSSRSLQRLLRDHGTTFHDEQTNARLTEAKKLLTASDAKVAAVAARVGWSERTLTTVLRARTGLSPTDWRKRERGT